MNQVHNHGLNQNKKIFKPIPPQVNSKKLISKKDESNNNNKPLGSSVYSKNKENLNKMMRDYQNFVKKYFGEATPISSMTEERMNKLLEEEKNFKSNDNKPLQQKKSGQNLLFDDFLKNSKDIDFGDDDINIELPSEENFNFGEEDKLGNKKNNKNDYERRRKFLFKQLDTEEEKYLQEMRELSAKKIQQIYREKFKDKLYIGFDKTKCIILRIYAHEYDKNKKIKSIEVKSYSKTQKTNINFVKDIKPLLGIDSITKEGIKKVMNQLIEKLLNLNEDKISIDKLTEIKNADKDEQKIKESHEEEEYEKEFQIENNTNKNEGKILKEENKSISSIDDADFNEY